jgi:hypothetical protein
MCKKAGNNINVACAHFGAATCTSARTYIRVLVLGGGHERGCEKHISKFVCFYA